jgi:E3 ubiquitin-protein ligase DOA10
MEEIARESCKYCFDSDEDGSNVLLNPCNCDGNLKFVHKRCLEKWIETNREHLLNDSIKNYECEICKHEYKIQFKRKIQTDFFCINICICIFISVVVYLFTTLLTQSYPELIINGINIHLYNYILGNGFVIIFLVIFACFRIIVLE